MMSALSYEIYDVFTDTAFSGNPLAVVFDADGLDTAKMQTIAAEFNLSETVFLLRPENADHMARLRIFMPRGELPFAGHPTVGATVALARREDAELSRIFMLEEKVGVLRCAYNKNGTGFGEFDLPILPKHEVVTLTNDAVAAALGLAAQEIGFENHIVSRWHAGVPYVCVPVRDLGSANRARFNEALWLSNFPGQAPIDVLCPYVYCRETVNHDASIHARLFAPHHGIPEDPATGSAAAAISGALNFFDGLPDGPSVYVIEQGIEMGRPSKIRIEMEIAGREITAARIGGHAVKIAEGRLLL